MNAMVKPEPQLVRYEAACRALAEARAVDEVQDVRNKADAMRIYGMQAKNKSLEVDAAEIRIRAERRLGELIGQQKAGEGLAKGAAMRGVGRAGKNAVESDDRIPTLAEAGISKDLSSRAQKLAAVPPEVFEAEVKEWRGRVEAENVRVTTRLEKAGERAAKPKKAEPTIEALLAENATLRDKVRTLQDNNRELASLLESYDSASEGEAAAAKALEKVKAQLRTVEATRDQWMTTAGELRKEVKALRRKAGVAK